MTVPVEPLPYWVVNLPREEWPEACPEYLLDLDARDREILGTRDADYKEQTWEEVVELAKINRPDLYQRVPSNLRKYLAYNWKLKQEYGSVMNFVLRERLHWTHPVTPRHPEPFADPDDVKILVNDWPYGVDPKIVHLLVWTKFELEEEAAWGDLTPPARQLIDDFVRRTFCERVRPEHVVWFRNWRSIKSVRAVEHFHVMLYDPDPDFVREITHGDVPLSQRDGI